MVRLAPLAVLILMLAGCGGGGGGGGAPTAVPPPVPDYYVDAANGLDTDPGTGAKPLKTITHALSLAQAGERIQVLPGSYDVANGEIFPLVVPAQVELIGDETGKGDGATPTLIRGGGLAPQGIPSNANATLFVDAGSTLAGFVVINPETAAPSVIAGVVVWKSDVSLRNCHVLDCFTMGVLYSHVSSGGELIGNVIARAGQIGVHFAYGPTGGRVEHNVITENPTGVWCLYGEPDLGAGAAGSAGANRIVGNVSRDLMVSANRTIAAQANYWDASPPSTETGMQVTPGTDIYEIDMSVVVDSAGALQNTDTLTIPLFP